MKVRYVVQMCAGCLLVGSGVTCLCFLHGDWLMLAFMIGLGGLTLFAYGVEHIMKDVKQELADKYVVLNESNTLKKYILLERARDMAVEDENYEQANKCQVLIDRLHEVEAKENQPGTLTLGL